MKLSKVEKYLLTNQLRILEALYPNERNHLAGQREALERGYEFIYSMDIDQSFDVDDEMTVEESKEVWNTMDMFLSIDRSIQKVGPEEFEGNYHKRFSGYDGNNETKFMAFASYTVERLKRFTHLPLEEPNYFNSHSPRREIYLRMLNEWEKIPAPNKYEMSRAQLEEVLGAAVYTEAGQ